MRSEPPEVSEEDFVHGHQDDRNYLKWKIINSFDGTDDVQMRLKYWPLGGIQASGVSTLVHAVPRNGGGEVKNCKLCKYSKLCNDLPGVCVLIPYLAVAVVAVAMGYLFITQELL